MADIEFQKTSFAEAAALAALHAASFGSAAWNQEQMQGSLALETTRGWAAREKGKLVGFILFQALPEQIEILTFVVHPDAQRRGIGEKLLQKLIETTPPQNNTRIFLEVAADNHAARLLYEKHGFRITGTRPNYYNRNKTPLDAQLYERILSEQ